MESPVCAFAVGDRAMASTGRTRSGSASNRYRYPAAMGSTRQRAAIKAIQGHIELHDPSAHADGSQDCPRGHPRQTQVRTGAQRRRGCLADGRSGGLGERRRPVGQPAGTNAQAAVQKHWRRGMGSRRLNTLGADEVATRGFTAIRTGRFGRLRDRVRFNAGAGQIASLMARCRSRRLLDTRACRCRMRHLHPARGKSAHGTVEHQGNAENRSQEDRPNGHLATLTSIEPRDTGRTLAEVQSSAR